LDELYEEEALELRIKLRRQLNLPIDPLDLMKFKQITMKQKVQIRQRKDLWFLSKEIMNHRK
jgi:hypothetical protein